MFGQVVRAELIKLRRAPIWIAFFALTALSAVMGTFNYLSNTAILTKQWYSLWTQHTLFAGFFFVPSLLGVLCAYLWRLEHCENNWNALMSRPVPLWMIFGGKLAVAAALSFLTQAATGVFYLMSGLYAGFDAPLPAQKVGAFDTELVEEFFLALVREAALTLHIRLMAGRNTHHIIEGIFKAVARALREACEIDPATAGEIPSTKGTLGGNAP